MKLENFCHMLEEVKSFPTDRPGTVSAPAAHISQASFPRVPNLAWHLQSPSHSRPSPKDKSYFLNMLQPPHAVRTKSISLIVVRTILTIWFQQPHLLSFAYHSDWALCKAHSLPPTHTPFSVCASYSFCLEPSPPVMMSPVDTVFPTSLNSSIKLQFPVELLVLSPLWRANI